MTERDTHSTSVLVTGGTGTLGSHVVRRLQERGCRVRVLSRKAPAGSSAAEFVAGDLVGDVGVDQAVADVDVIVHCASASRGDVEATRNLVRAAAGRSPRPHLVYISIVGVDGVRFGYFRTKLAVEQVVVESGMPWSLLRATQFYDYILSGARGMTRFPIVPVPKGFQCQAVDVTEVADRLVDVALAPPAGRVPDIGGPEVSTWADMIRQYLEATHRRRLVVPLPLPGMRAVRDGGLLLPDRRAGVGRTWEEFLADRLAPTAS
jgi:uncharacterized protein YbjT (DUF2867 family)